MNKNLTIEELNGIFEYKNNDLYFRISKGKYKKGKLAGRQTKRGYRQVGIKGNLYLIHRLIYTLLKGTAPLGIVDHIDGNPFNNAIENLRDVSHLQNSANRGKSKNNKTGHAGIIFCIQTGKYRVDFNFNRKRYYLGRFDKLEDAVREREFFARQIRGDYNRLLVPSIKEPDTK